jgi:hypothetical protein
MRNRLLKILLLIGVLICLLSVQPASAQNHDNKKINQFIYKQARANKADEYKKARRIIYADINKDGRKDTVVLYTLESFGGSNLYRQYLAIFVRNPSRSIKNVINETVGGKNNRDVYLESVANGKINVRTLNYLPKDASCCPSKEEYSQITFSKNKLREVKIN